MTIIAPSDWMSALIRPTRLFSNNPLEVVVNAFNESTFRAIDKAFCRDALGIPPDKKVVLFAANYLGNYRTGKEIALTAGIDFARGACVIPIDVDLQDPPEVIPQLIAKWREGFDVVYATRHERLGETMFKRATASAFYRLIGGMTRFHVPKNTGDFRLMDRRVVDALKQLRETNRFMKGLFSWVGFNQTGIAYRRGPRFRGKTKWSYGKLFNLAIEGITSFSDKPLRIASVFGVLISLFAMGYGLYMIIRTLLWGNPVPGYTSLMAVILFLGGIQLIAIGVIGEYVGRTYNESKQRPLYLSKGLWGINDRNIDPDS